MSSDQQIAAPTFSILPCLYFGPVHYYSKLAQGKECVIDLHEHFQKQTYRNRTVICDSNGRMNLIIPLKKHPEKTAMKDIRISYDAPWQNLHWKTLESAYRSSPFFEYFEDDFLGFYTGEKYEFLAEYNLAIQAVVLKLLKLKPQIRISSEYHKNYMGGMDYRGFISPKRNPKDDPDLRMKHYPQVFEQKFGFLENLSIADLLFNMGPEAIALLRD
jgi:hypothetical protein